MNDLPGMSLLQAKQALASARKERNARILARCLAGVSLSEIARQEHVCVSTVFRVLEALGPYPALTAFGAWARLSPEDREYFRRLQAESTH